MGGYWELLVDVEESIMGCGSEGCPAKYDRPIQGAVEIENWGDSASVS